ncbi:MAG: molybdopterin molybdotransferase MoeA [Flavobacteriales bacterium]|nr:molybdopterin molybdotransferase MoeA [Flavobacteriales bacterium]
MISVEEAKRIMMEHAQALVPGDMALSSANGFVVEDVIAPYDHPLFDMSAVDGYAFRWSSGVSTWDVVGEVAAGEHLLRELAPGECARVFTGAMVPMGADTIVMQEFVERAGDRITHSDNRLNRGGNIRKKGEQLQRGQVVLAAGERLDAAAKGLLASVGVFRVKSIRSPGVSVIITGSEFSSGPVPEPGQIFGSNDVMLEALIAQAGATTELVHVPDEMVVLEEAITRAVAHADVVISTGGASVGDHDLVHAAIERCGGRAVFHGVAQKPGKPMLFAMFGDKPFFGLPGNPRAVAVLFWEYVVPFIRTMKGAKDPWLIGDVLPVTHTVNVKGDRAEFRAAQVKGGKVTLLPDEGSHMLRSLVEGNALAYLPAHQRTINVGDELEIHYLPR